jgi:type 1 fimbriae regulatory protein FimB
MVAATQSKVVKLRPARAPRHRQAMVALEGSELMLLLETARAKSTRDWAMLLTAYCHGLRASEVCGLKMADLDMRSQSIRCNRLKGSLESVQSLSPHRGNPLLDEVKALREWLKVRQDDGSGYLFLSGKGGAMSRVQFFRLFQGYAKEAGLHPAKRHPHCLKHSLVTHMVSADQNLAKIQQAAGHRAISSTMKYVTVSERQADKARQETFMRVFG